MHEQVLSRNRTAQTPFDLFGVDLAPGTVSSAASACAAVIAPVGQLVADRIAAAGLAHLDETGVRAAGACHWLHSASTPEAVFPSRTCKGIGGLGGRFPADLRDRRVPCIAACISGRAPA